MNPYASPPPSDTQSRSLRWRRISCAAGVFGYVLPFIVLMTCSYVVGRPAPLLWWPDTWTPLHERIYDAITNGRGSVAALATFGAQIACLVVFASFTYLRIHRICTWRLIAFGSLWFAVSLAAASVLGYRSLFTGWTFKGDLNFAIGVAWFFAAGIVGCVFLRHLRGVVLLVNQIPTNHPIHRRTGHRVLAMETLPPVLGDR